MTFPWLISTISSVVLYPFHATTIWIKTSENVFPTYLRSKSELASELESLKQSIANDTGTQLSIKRLIEENIQLRGMANASPNEDRLVARVISRPDSMPYDLLEIDRGSRDGVEIGAPVYTGVDSVVGIIVHAGDTYSFVDLFTSPGFESTAFIFGPNVFSPIEGIGGGIARVRLPQGVLIREGQLVILPGVSNGVYGEIVRVENEPTQPEQFGYIAPPVAMTSLQYVSIGRRPITSKSQSEIDESVRAVLRETLRFSSTSTIAAFATSTDDVNIQEEFEDVDDVEFQ
jgi:cell shape-determining protein MreC